MLTSCPRCTGKLQLDATMVRCDACGSLWLSRKDMESEAARRAVENAKAEEYIGAGKLQNDLDELVILTKINQLEKLFSRVESEAENSREWLKNNEDNSEALTVYGMNAGYSWIMSYMLGLLNEYSDEWEDIMRRKKGKEDE